MPEPEMQVEKILWERKKEVGFLRVFWRMWKGIIFHPIRFFSKLQTNEGLGSSLLFVLTAGFLNSITVCGAYLLAVIFFFGISKAEISSTSFFCSKIFAVVFLLQTVKTYGTSFIFSLGFWLVGVRRGYMRGLRTAFQVIAYSTAVDVLGLIVLVVFLIGLLGFSMADILMRGNFLMFFLTIIHKIVLITELFLIGVYPFILYFIGFRCVYKLSIPRTLCGFILPTVFFISVWMFLPKQPQGGMCPLISTEKIKYNEAKSHDVKAATEASNAKE